ncbi:DUF6318 family protein [Pseudarthrobacter sp. P1]|uniref:DUF6318 family protein n=1 Tax=Pseudarthrobacter sp. P1 TaxID=3418418 RepID=UPI003CF9C99F
MSSTGALPTPSGTATPTAAPVYKPADATGPAQNVPVPVKAALADEFSKAGIEEFSKYWYETLSYAYETGDMSPMEAITDPGCSTCANVKEVVTGWHSEGRWLVGGKMEVFRVQSDYVAQSNGTYQAIAFVQQGGVDYYNADGTIHKSAPTTKPITDIFVARYSDGHWKADVVEHASGQPK